MQVYRSLFSACSILAFLALLLGLDATPVCAQTEASADIQLEADGKASTDTEVGAKAGGQVVIEILASGFGGALAVEATLTVSDPSAITAVTGTHKVGLSFPGNGPIRNWSVGDSEIKYQSGGKWVSGVIESTDPVVLSLDDDTEIRTTHDILATAVAEGLVVAE